MSLLAQWLKSLEPKAQVTAYYRASYAQLKQKTALDQMHFYVSCRHDGNDNSIANEGHEEEKRKMIAAKKMKMSTKIAAMVRLSVLMTIMMTGWWGLEMKQLKGLMEASVK